MGISLTTPEPFFFLPSCAGNLLTVKFLVKLSENIQKGEEESVENKSSSISVSLSETVRCITVSYAVALTL